MLCPFYFVATNLLFTSPQQKKYQSKVNAETIMHKTTTYIHLTRTFICHVHAAITCIKLPRTYSYHAHTSTTYIQLSRAYSYHGHRTTTNIQLSRTDIYHVHHVCMLQSCTIYKSTTFTQLPIQLGIVNTTSAPIYTYRYYLRAHFGHIEIVSGILDAVKFRL